jgi:hypothetical protein
MIADETSAMLRRPAIFTRQWRRRTIRSRFALIEEYETG